MALGFNPISASPISSIPIYYPFFTGLVATGSVGTVTATSGRSFTVTGVVGTGIIRSVSTGKGATITLTGAIGTATVTDHQCVRTWNPVNTLLC